MNWKSFIIGILIGLLIGLGLFYEFGERYEVRGMGPKGIWNIKVDKWTGRTWILRYGKDDNGEIIVYFWEKMPTATGKKEEPWIF